MPPSYIQITARLILSIFLGGIIGMERETINRPAGFRTHILVCLGSTVIMLASLFIFSQFQGKTNLDPGRIPAQVINGIGFIGAGTIIIEGSTVKGLTTAATLWTVAVIGLSVGMGFYFGSILATFLILLTLMTLSQVEDLILGKRNPKSLLMVIEDVPGQIGKIGSILGKMDVSIKNIQLDPMEEQKLMLVLKIKKKSRYPLDDIMDKLIQIEGVHSIKQGKSI